MLITEANKWSQIITEEYGVQDRNKLDWMSKYAQIHAIHEAQQNPNVSIDGGIYSTPLNTLGIGNPMMPEPADGFKSTTGIGNTGADFHNPLYNNGSGDIPMSTLPMALEIAAITIGFELVPVIPSTGPWTMLTYFDTPYAGGKLGKLNETWADGIGKDNENKPIYIKFNCPAITFATGKTKKDIAKESQVTIGTSNAAPTWLTLGTEGQTLMVKNTAQSGAPASLTAGCGWADTITYTVDSGSSANIIVVYRLKNGSVDTSYNETGWTSGVKTITINNVAHATNADAVLEVGQAANTNRNLLVGYGTATDEEYKTVEYNSVVTVNNAGQLTAQGIVVNEYTNGAYVSQTSINVSDSLTWHEIS